MEKSKATNKFKILKTILFSLLLVLSYVASVYVKGFAKTNTRLLYLLVFVFLGFCSFYIVYYIIRFFSRTIVDNSAELLYCIFVDFKATYRVR